MLSPDTASTASSNGEGSVESNEQLQHRKLNEFLQVCKIQPLERSWLDWHDISDRTKQRYVQKTCEIVSSVIKAISTDNAQHLWKSVQTSVTVNRMLGQSPCHLPSESAYLEALAEAYKAADSWDTRRQVLSTMSDLANFNAISEFIPGLTRYRLTMANLHRVQHGRSAPVPIKAAPRIRIQKQQLDHFLSFITSPHLVQDLPFGEKHLQLSSGKMITVPNVIRTMIPERIATQYIQYCKGGRAFDDLMSTVKDLSAVTDSDGDWTGNIQEALKMGKLYLKGDYKVVCFINEFQINSVKLNNCHFYDYSIGAHQQ